MPDLFCGRRGKHVDVARNKSRISSLITCGRGGRYRRAVGPSPRRLLRYRVNQNNRGRRQLTGDQQQRDGAAVAIAVPFSGAQCMTAGRAPPGAADVISFSKADGDRINVARIDADSSTPAVDDAFTFVMTDFTAPGQLRVGVFGTRNAVHDRRSRQRRRRPGCGRRRVAARRFVLTDTDFIL
jgi:hypothetical protein